MDINAEHSMQPTQVYLDNGATTRVDERVAQAAMEAMLVAWGNPSSAHALGAEAARRVAARARTQVAAALGGAAAEVTFTSGGTEANALAVLGATARAKHVVVSAFEHPSVADAAKALAERGVEVTAVAPAPSGVVAPEAFAAAVRPDTALVACMWVQNEIGTVQPVDAIARAVKARAPRCHVHVDGVQALGKLAVDVADAPYDSLAISAHKIHGPKGVGALWLKRGARVRPLVFGGGQERGLRPGTEGVPGIVALGLACELAAGARVGGGGAHGRAARGAVAGHRRGASRRRGATASRRTTAPHILSVGFAGVPAEPLLHALEAEGVYVSAGSACHAKDKKPSATLRAIGVPDDIAVIRLSLSRFTTADEIARAARWPRVASAGVASAGVRERTTSVRDEVVLVRWGEIFLKGDNRGFFERALVERVQRALAPLARRARRAHPRPPPRLAGRSRRPPRACARSSASSASSASRRRAWSRATSPPSPPSPSSWRAPRRQSTRRRPSRSSRAAATSASPSARWRSRAPSAPPSSARSGCPSTCTRRRSPSASRSATSRRSCSPRSCPAPAGCRSASPAASSCCSRAGSTRPSPAGSCMKRGCLARRHLLPLVPLHRRKDAGQGGAARRRSWPRGSSSPSASRSCPSPTRKRRCATPPATAAWRSCSTGA